MKNIDYSKVFKSDSELLDCTIGAFISGYNSVLFPYLRKKISINKKNKMEVREQNG